MRRQSDRHDLSIAWIGYTDFLATMAVLFLALYLGSRAPADVEVTVLGAPAAQELRVAVDGLDAQRGLRGQYHARLPSISKKGQLVEIVVRAGGSELRLTKNVLPKAANVFELDFSKRPIEVYELEADESFERSKYDLTLAAMDSLAAFANRKDVTAHLKRANTVILVCGYTDKSQYRDDRDKNWDLSAMRAVAVCKYLINNCGIDPWRVVAAGFGEHQPREREDVAGPALEVAQAKNRRIELLLIEASDRFGAYPNNWK